MKTRNQIRAIKAKGYDTKNRRLVSFDVLGVKDLKNGTEMLYGISPISPNPKVYTIRTKRH